MKPLCSKCNERPVESQGHGTFFKVCWKCRRPERHRVRNKFKKKKYRRLVELTSCQKCGFIAEHKCQLDVDHIDGDHKNNDPSNLQVLCANCHRLKTFMNKDYLQ